MEYLLRGLRFLVRNLAVLLVLFILVLMGFRMGMDTTHAFIIVSDGMKERVAEILLPAETQTDLTQYFTPEFLESDPLLTANPYAQDRISSYDYDLDLGLFYCVPGRSSVKMEAVLEVSDIDGVRETGLLDENGRAITQEILDWDRIRMEIVCIKRDGHWLISGIEEKEILDPRPTPTDEPVVTPRPTATPVPEPEFTGRPVDFATPAPAFKLGEVKVSDALNVRAEPSGNAEKLGVLYNGDEVEILEEVNGWYRIHFEGGEGYVSSRYVRIPE